jgi:hypothetical protein
MFAKPNDTSKALILNSKSVHGLSRWTLRLTGVSGNRRKPRAARRHYGSFFRRRSYGRDVRLALHHRWLRGARSGDHPRRLAVSRRQAGRPALLARSRLERSPAVGHCQSAVLVILSTVGCSHDRRNLHGMAHHLYGRSSCLPMAWIESETLMLVMARRPARFGGAQLAREDREENGLYAEVTSTLWCTLLERSPGWPARYPREPPRGRQ